MGESMSGRESGNKRVDENKGQTDARKIMDLCPVDGTDMSWEERKQAAALLLAHDIAQRKIAAYLKINPRTIWKWTTSDKDFKALVAKYAQMVNQQLALHARKVMQKQFALTMKGFEVLGKMLDSEKAEKREKGLVLLFGKGGAINSTSITQFLTPEKNENQNPANAPQVVINLDPSTQRTIQAEAEVKKDD